MQKRGRKSSEDLKVTVNIPKRPDAPSELTDRQAEVWRETVNTMPVDWFPSETHYQLADYCRHVTYSRDIAERIQAMDTETADTQDMDRLYRMQDRESNAISRIATKLRITNQSRVRAETAGRQINNRQTPQGGAEVWENY